MCATMLALGEPSQRAGDAVGHELVAAGVGVDFVALQLGMREDAAEDVRDEKAALVFRDSLVHRVVVRVDTREAEAEEDHGGAGGFDLVDRKSTRLNSSHIPLSR